MGRGDQGGSSGQEKRGGKRKNKARMNYLNQVRQNRGGRGGGRGGGDYVSAYDRNGQKKRQRQYLHAGMRGFLLTTNFRESDCVREGYNLLNEYYRPEEEEGIEGAAAAAVLDTSGGEKKEVVEGQTDQALAKEETASGSQKKEESNDDGSDLDIDKALEKEMKELKSGNFKFQSVDTGAKNIVFIKTSLKRPSDIVYRIFEDVLANKETKSRNIMRFIPIEGTSNTNDNAIREMSKEIFTPYFKDGYKSFKILPNIRHSKIPKDQLIKTLADVVCEINPLNIVDLTNPEYTIVAEVIKATLCLTVLKDFLKFKKFNIVEIVSPTPVPVPQQKTDPAAETPMEQEEGKDNGNVEDKPVAATDEEIPEDKCDDVKPATDLQQSALLADVQDA